MIKSRRLTKREVAALDCVVEFLVNKEAAEHLGFSEPLLAKLLRTAYRKLGVRTRTQAAVVWTRVT